jgi:SAM-dependent methyltransferase
MTSAQTIYFERVAHTYLKASGQGLWGRLRSAEWRTVRDCLELEPGMDVLDAGCGAGYYSLRLRDEAGARVAGVDSSPAMIAAYREQGFEGYVDSVDTFRTDNRYDRILIAGVLEFIERPEPALKNLAGLLRSGGRIAALVPAAGLAGAAYRAIHRLRGCPAFIRDPDWYLRLALSSGLETIKFAKATPISCAFSLRSPGHG